MFRLNFLLRCLLIVAFCLDGSAALWSASSMAVSMARHGPDAIGQSQLQLVHDGGGEMVATSDVDCPEGEVPAQGGSGHENCHCTSSVCQCPSGFTSVTMLHGVPFAAQHRLSALLTMPESASVVRSSLSSVFRPPIG